MIDRNKERTLRIMMLYGRCKREDLLPQFLFATKPDGQIAVMGGQKMGRLEIESIRAICWQYESNLRKEGNW